jgi:hypothetical protein
MRNLASIQLIKSITPIEGKDRICLARVLDWNVIVNKNDFQVGDLCLYFEIDSILPVRKEFEFLRARCYSDKWNGFRIKTLKMSGVLSQGLALPINPFTEIRFPFVEGRDVTELLGVRKYEPLEEKDTTQSIHKPKSRLLRFLLRNKLLRNFLYPPEHLGDFPSFVEETDETRVQSIGATIEAHKGLACYYTEKLDGQSSSFIYHKRKFYICSREKIKNKKGNSNFAKVAKKYNLEKIVKKLSRKFGSLALQGEVIGSGVQSNKYEKKELEFYVFSIFLIEKHRYANYYEFTDIMSHTQGINTVPILKTDYELGSVEELLELAKGNSVINPSVLREGIVVRSLTGEPRNLPKIGSHFSFKAINNDFLIKHGL